MLRQRGDACTVSSAAPLVDQIRDQTAPSSLVAGAEAHAGISVVVLVEEETIAPVRILLELGVGAEDGALAAVLFENRNHTIGDLFGEGSGRDGLATDLWGREVFAQSVAEAEERVDEEIRGWE